MTGTRLTTARPPWTREGLLASVLLAASYFAAALGKRRRAAVWLPLVHGSLYRRFVNSAHRWQHRRVTALSQNSVRHRRSGGVGSNTMAKLKVRKATLPWIFVGLSCIALIVLHQSTSHLATDRDAHYKEELQRLRELAGTQITTHQTTRPSAPARQRPLSTVPTT